MRNCMRMLSWVLFSMPVRRRYVVFVGSCSSSCIRACLGECCASCSVRLLILRCMFVFSVVSNGVDGREACRFSISFAVVRMAPVIAIHACRWICASLFRGPEVGVFPPLLMDRSIVSVVYMSAA